jgi:hypothetical protein
VRVQAVMVGSLPEPAIYPGGAHGFTAFRRAQALGLADDTCGWSPNTVTKMFCTILNTPSTPNPARNERAEAEKATPPPLRGVAVVPAPDGARRAAAR